MTQYIGESKWSKAFVLNLVSCLLLAAAAARVLSAQRPLLRISRTFTLIPTVLFTLATALSFLRSTNWHMSFQAVALVGGSFAVYFVVVCFVRDLSTVRKIFLTSFVAAVIVASFGILQKLQFFYLPLTQYGQRNPGSFLGLTNFAAEFLIIPFAMSIGLLAEAKKGITKWLCGVGCAVILWYLVITENRAGWVALGVEFLVGLPLYFYFSPGTASMKSAPARKALIGISLCVLLILGSAGQFTDYGKRLARRAASVFHLSDPTINTRLLTWKTARNVIKDHPLWGVGLANSEIHVPKYADIELERAYLQSNTKIDQLHNEYLQILVESGALGFLAFLLLIFSLVRLAIRAFKQVSDSQQRRYVVVLLAGVFGFLANIVFSFALRNPASALYFWLALALLEVASLPISEPVRLQSERMQDLRMRHWVFAFSLLAGTWFFGYLTYYSALTAKAELNYNVATSYLGLKTWRAVVEHSTKAIDLNPRMEKYYYVRAAAYSNLNNFDSAVADLKRCIAMAPYFERAHLNLAFDYYRLGQFEKSRDEFLLAGSLMKSRKPDILNALAPVFIGLKDAPKAVDVGREAVNLEPGNAKYRYDLARLYALTNQFDRAAAECQKALELRPDFTPAKAFLEEIRGHSATNLALTK
jgi:O-antigen ligase/Tfp pilus assembly protein PilF